MGKDKPGDWTVIRRQLQVDNQETVSVWNKQWQKWEIDSRDI